MAKAFTLSNNGTTLKVGSYPQTQVKDRTMVERLNALAGELPTAQNAHGWADLGYYSGGRRQSLAWCRDVQLQGVRYRAMYLAAFRPRTTEDEPPTFRSENYIARTKTPLWFRWEPIVWNVLYNNGRQALAASSVVLDAQSFSNALGKYGGVSANDYAHSGIRKWLNGEFFNAAFSAEERASIAEWYADNRACTAENFDVDLESVWDKVFLLSFSDVRTPAFGFCPESVHDKPPRFFLHGTDYAFCNGLGDGGSTFPRWWLRSAQRQWSDTDSYASAAEPFGNCAVNAFKVNCTDVGVVPAICVQLVPTEQPKPNVEVVERVVTKQVPVEKVVTKTVEKVVTKQVEVLPSADSLCRQGIEAYNGGDHAKAYSLFGQAAFLEDAEAMAWLAYCYINGVGTSENRVQGCFWNRLAAERGNVTAQYNLALAYEQGKGVEKNLEEAAYWYFEAAEKGHQKAKTAYKRLEKLVDGE